jgi:pimeloyl-ACP methyl ester carboxylesterase
VQIARLVAGQGFPAFRFDFAGIGDSPARRDALPFDRSLVADAQEVMDDIRAATGSTRFLLLGLSFGAVAAVRVAAADQRVAGVVLVNAFGTPGAEAAGYVRRQRQWQYYLRTALWSPRSLLKAATGRASYRTIWKTLIGQVTGCFSRPGGKAGEADPMAAEWCRLCDRGVRVLLVSSTGGASHHYLHLFRRQIQTLEAAGKLRAEVIPGADHVFIRLCHQQLLLEKLRDGMRWLTEDSSAAGTVSPFRANS